jgi:hypothetical protein
MRIIRASFQSYCPQNPVVINQTLLSSSSLKPRARHSLLKELNLASLSELTPRKKKLYNYVNIFGIGRVHFVNSKRNTRERS